MKVKVLLASLLALTACGGSSELYPAKPMRQWESCKLFDPFEPGGEVPNASYDAKLVANQKQEQDYIDCGRYKFEIPLEFDQSPDYTLQSEFCQAVYTRGSVSKEAYEICITAYGDADYKGFALEGDGEEDRVVTAAELEEQRQQNDGASNGHVLGSSIGTTIEYNGVIRKNAFNWCGIMPDPREFRYDAKMNPTQTGQVLACATKSSTPVAEDRKYVCDTYRDRFYTETDGAKVAVMHCGEYEFPGDMTDNCSNDDGCFDRFDIRFARSPRGIPARFYTDYFNSEMTDDEIKARALQDYRGHVLGLIKLIERRTQECIAVHQNPEPCHKQYGPHLEKLKHIYNTRLVN